MNVRNVLLTIVLGGAAAILLKPQVNGVPVAPLPPPVQPFSRYQVVPLQGQSPYRLAIKLDTITGRTSVLRCSPDCIWEAAK